VPAPQEDPARVIRDLPLMPLARPAAQPAPRSREPRPEDYLPRHASATPAPGEPDRRLYIKLTEEQSETVLRFVEAHGSEPFSRALRELIESLPRTK
jgi:hypothetical protein